MTLRAACHALVVLGLSVSGLDAGHLADPVAAGREWFVTVNGDGSGTAQAPFGRIQDALQVARAGDVVTLAPGTYSETVRTVRGGTPGEVLTIRSAAGRGAAIVTHPGRVLTVRHPHVVVDGLVLDGQYGPSDLVAVATAGHGFILRDSELRRTGRDALDMAAPTGVLVERALIHHALNSSGGRTDAHGIVAGGVRQLTIRDTEIHTFSGDAIQVDPSRSHPGWTDVLIERCRLWLAPLATPENGFPAGAVPGENAVDTKAAPGAVRATIRIRDTLAWGFRGGAIANMAAFNLKEHIDAQVEGVTVWDSDVAFRVRGPGRSRAGAHVTVQNAVVYDVNVAFRYEDNVELLRVWNATIGGGVARPFRAAASGAEGLDVRNLLIAGTLPREAAHTSNLAAGPDAFVDTTRHDYRLRSGSVAVDRGVAIPGVNEDRDGVSRPQGRAYDVGAYERRSRPPEREGASRGR